jgi:hypothetical protein
VLGGLGPRAILQEDSMELIGNTKKVIIRLAFGDIVEALGEFIKSKYNVPYSEAHIQVCASIIDGEKSITAEVTIDTDVRLITPKEE